MSVPIPSLLGTSPPDATGSWVLSGVCVATPVLPSGRRCPWPAGRAVAGTEDGTDWTSGGKWGRVEDAAEGEGENRGGKEKYRQTDHEKADDGLRNEFKEGIQRTATPPPAVIKCA